MFAVFDFSIVLTLGSSKKKLCAGLQIAAIKQVLKSTKRHLTIMCLIVIAHFLFLTQFLHCWPRNAIHISIFNSEAESYWIFSLGSI